MFESVEAALPDAILGITEAFGRDAHPHKINLSVGIYKDAKGATPILECVKEAQKRILADEVTKAYKPIQGAPQYGVAVQGLLFGQGHEIVANNRAATAHTPGGTGALRVAGDYLKRLHPGASIWMSDPTWANHANIFQGAGLTIKKYAYFDPATNSLAFDRMVESLGQIPAGDVVLLHGCCHNPTGVDLTADQWSQVADLVG